MLIVDICWIGLDFSTLCRRLTHFPPLENGEESSLQRKERSCLSSATFIHPPTYRIFCGTSTILTRRGGKGNKYLKIRIGLWDEIQSDASDGNNSKVRRTLWKVATEIRTLKITAAHPWIIQSNDGLRISPWRLPTPDPPWTTRCGAVAMQLVSFQWKVRGGKTPVSNIFAQFVVRRRSRSSLHRERCNNGTYVPAHRVRPEGGERELSPTVRVAITADWRVDFARRI